MSEPDAREKGRQYWIQKEKEALEKYAPPGIEFFMSLVPGQIEKPPEGAPDAISSDLGLLDPVELAVDLTPIGLAAGMGLGALKKVDKALPSASGFTSKLEDVIRQKMSSKATAQEIEAMVKSAGVKAEELEDIRFTPWLQEIENYLLSSGKLATPEIPPSTSVPMPQIKKGQVLEYVTGSRPELGVTEYSVKKHNELIEAARKERLESKRELNSSILSVLQKYERNRIVSGADFVSENASEKFEDFLDAIITQRHSGVPYNKNEAIKKLMLEVNLNPAEVLDDIEALVRKKVTFNQNSDRFFFLKQNASGTKWSRYSLSSDGEKNIGENYREYVFTYNPTGYLKDDLPFGKKMPRYRSESHWPGVENPVYHVRVQDLTDDAGRKFINIDEIQSDIHQMGQKFGYHMRPMSEENRDKLIGILRDQKLILPSGVRPSNKEALERAMYLPDDEFAKIEPILKESGLAEDLPFKRSWYKQGFRRIIKEALDAGKDGVSWTAGKVQARRAGQDLGQVTSIAYDPNLSKLIAYRNEMDVFDKQVPQQQISQYVGSDLAKEIKERLKLEAVKKAAFEEAQKKQDDYAKNLYVEWIKKNASKSGELIEQSFAESIAANNLKAFSTWKITQDEDALRQLYSQLEKAGLSAMQIADLRNPRTYVSPPIEIAVNSESFGGSGMQTFYDQIFPNMAKEEAKRLGATVSKTTVTGPDKKPVELWSFVFGPKTKAFAQDKGFPLYTVPAAVGLTEVVKEMKKEQESKK